MPPRPRLKVDLLTGIPRAERGTYDHRGRNWISVTSPPIVSRGVVVTPVTISDYPMANEIITSGRADGIALARAFLRNPRWVWDAADELGADVFCPAQYERGRHARHIAGLSRPLVRSGIDRAHRPSQAAVSSPSSHPGKTNTAGWHLRARAMTLARSMPRLTLSFSIAESVDCGMPVALESSF